MPKEYDSMFKPYFKTPKWNRYMWLRQSPMVLITVEYEDGTIRTETGKTHDGEWWFAVPNVNREVIAWMPMPRPFNLHNSLTRR